MHNEIMELVEKMKKLGVSSVNVELIDNKPFISIGEEQLLYMFGSDVEVSPSQDCDGVLSMKYETTECIYISAILDYKYEKWQKEQAAKESVV